MTSSPFTAFAHLKESLVSYLETAYKVSHADVFRERRSLLEDRGAIAQEAFIETTPGYPDGRHLRDVATAHADRIPPEIVELLGFGTPLSQRPLWTHQDQAIELWCGAKPNLVVATGTASGKTEIFLVPILARLIKEALNWPAPTPQQPSGWDRSSNSWRHCRLHERRKPGVRSIILYPTNALVNDQVRRLRRILASEQSERWQKSKFKTNVIRFGMYTSETDPTGHWTQSYRRKAWDNARNEILSTWAAMPAELRETGGWPRLDGPEMLCRWDMQLSPPDILVTNYSMLEYMLVRPIESSVFSVTQRWLDTTPGAVFTLVLDEAHTYRGARGTEIAFLIRRLKERLGIRSGDRKFQVIATSASLPSGQEDEALTTFAARLVGEDQNLFSVVHLPPLAPVPAYQPVEAELAAFGAFAKAFRLDDPLPAIRQLAAAVGNRVSLARDPDPAVCAYLTFANYPQLIRLPGYRGRFLSAFRVAPATH